MRGPASSSSTSSPSERRNAATRSAAGRSDPGGVGSAASSMKISQTCSVSAPLPVNFGVNLMNVAQPLVQASLLGEAIDAGPALVFVADEDMQYVAVNETACAELGYEREELLALRVTDVAASADAPEAYARMVASGEAAGR